MELTAVLELLRHFPPEQPLLIKPDSRNVVMTFTEWLQDWIERGMRRPGGQPVANRELIETIAELANGRDICWKKVKSHSGDTLNDMADYLAGLGRIAAKRLGRTYRVGPASLIGLIGFQWGVTVVRRFQLGLPAYRSARIL